MGISLHLDSNLEQSGPSLHKRSDMKALCDVFIGDDTLQHLRVLERWFWIGLAPLRKVAYHREDSEPGDYSEDLEEDKRIREELEAFNQA